MTLDNGTLLEMQRRMLRIRHFDERASKMVKRGQIPGTVHTSIGQEAIAVAVMGIMACDSYAKAVRVKDPSECVIDEVAGQWIALGLERGALQLPVDPAQGVAGA